MVDEIDGLKQLAGLIERDERWRLFGNRTIEQHHALIARHSLHGGVPNAVVQHFENARNTWLYAFFSYRLLQVALLELHVAGAVAIKVRAEREGTNTQSKPLEKLLDLALERRWLLDVNFESSPTGPSGKQSTLKCCA